MLERSLSFSMPVLFAVLIWMFIEKENMDTENVIVAAGDFF